MKKCPKCGTILDDSKKKCYMCGADLTASASVGDFSSNFDKSIGSSVTKGVDNVFNNGKDIDVDSEDILGGASNNNNGSFFSHNSSSRDFFGGEINKLNSMSFDNRSKSKKKINSFFGKNDLKSKDEINKKKQKKKGDDSNQGKVKKISYSTNPNIPKEMQEAAREEEKEVKPSNNMFFPSENSFDAKTIKSNLVKKEDNNVPDAFKSFNSFVDEGKGNKKNSSFIPNNQQDNSTSIDRFGLKKNDGGNKLSKNKVNSAFAMFNGNKKSFYNNDNDVEIEIENKNTSSIDNQRGFKLKTSKNPFEGLKQKLNIDRLNSIQVKEYGRIAFNFSCVIIFMIILCFVYFKFLRMDSAEKLDGLQFKVPQYFKLSNTGSHYKFYSSKEHGNSCSFEILSGVPSDPNGYVDDYFQYVKKTYETDSKAVPTLQEMKINGNTWKSERIVYLPDDGSKVSSGDIIARYAYTVIVYNGSFYTIKSSNTEENKECDDKLFAFMNSVAFIEENK